MLIDFLGFLSQNHQSASCGLLRQWRLTNWMPIFMMRQNFHTNALMRTDQEFKIVYRMSRQFLVKIYGVKNQLFLGQNQNFASKIAISALKRFSWSKIKIKTLHGTTRNNNTNEDCLYLNIHVPKSASDGNTKLAVLIYFHGGAFITGSNDRYYEQPDYFAQTSNLIIVKVSSYYFI